MHSRLWKKAGLIDRNKVADSETDTHWVECSGVLSHSSSHKWNGGNFKAKWKKEKVWYKTLCLKKCVQANKVKGFEASAILAPPALVFSSHMCGSSLVLSRPHGRARLCICLRSPPLLSLQSFCNSHFHLHFGQIKDLGSRNVYRGRKESSVYRRQKRKSRVACKCNWREDRKEEGNNDGPDWFEWLDCTAAKTEDLFVPVCMCMYCTTLLLMCFHFYVFIVVANHTSAGPLIMVHFTLIWDQAWVWHLSI